MVAEAPGLLIDEGRIYREPTLESEIAVAETLRGRAAEPPHLDHEPGDAPEGSLTDEQWAAVRGAFAARISILTGGPGVGKTVCTRAIVEEAGRADARIALCAPTGRAARRLEEATGAGGADDPPHARVDAGRRARPSSPATPCPPTS